MDEQDMESLVADLTCEDFIKCQKARRSLVDMGHKAVPLLIEAMNNYQGWVQWEAAKALSQIGDPTATEHLISSLEDKEFEIRWLAAEGLIHIGKEVVLQLLRALIDKPGSNFLREGAHHILHDMYREDWDSILKPVMAALEGPEPSVEVPLAANRTLKILEKQVTD